MLRQLARRAFGKRSLRGTTVLSVRKDGKVGLIGDGRVCLGSTIFKNNVVKIRRITPNVLCGFAGSTADCLALLELLEKEFERFPKQTLRVCISLAKQWRTDRMHRHLQCDMIVCDPNLTIIINGHGDAIEIDEGAAAIGSGGMYALAAARALLDVSGLSAKDVAHRAMNIAADLCVYTNKHLTYEEISLPPAL